MGLYYGSILFLLAMYIMKNNPMQKVVKTFGRDYVAIYPNSRGIVANRLILMKFVTD